MRSPGEFKRLLRAGQIGAAAPPLPAFHQAAIGTLHDEVFVPGRRVAINILIVVVKAEEITLFTSGGIASEYVVIAARIYEKALRDGVGQRLDMKRDDSVPKALYSRRVM